MQARISKIARKEDEAVIIRCVEITPQVRDIYSYAMSRGTELSGIAEGRISSFCLDEVCYFEALDEKVFAYTNKQIYEIKMRLYEVEQAYEASHFVRCSKSVVLNLMRLDGISPAMNGRFLAHMKNGEKVMISRQYVPALKRAVMGTGD